MKIPLRWTSDRDNYDMMSTNEGPIAEIALEAEIGMCSRCGKDPREVGSGIIVEGEVHQGVLTGLVLCGECIDALPG